MHEFFSLASRVGHDPNQIEFYLIWIGMFDKQLSCYKDLVEFLFNSSYESSMISKFEWIIGSFQVSLLKD